VFVVGLLAATVLLPAGAVRPAAADAARAQALLTTSRVIYEFDADGGRLAWLQVAGPSVFPTRCFAAYRYSFATGATVRLVRRRCPEPGSTGGFGGLDLSGTRAFWDETAGGLSYTDWALFSTAHPHSTARLARGAFFCDPGLDCGCRTDIGTVLGPREGSEGTFVYTTTDLAAGPSCPDPPHPLVSDSRIRRIVTTPSGLHTGVIPNTPGAMLLAYRAGRVALVPLANGLPPEDQPADHVEIRNATTGALVSQFSPPGTIRALGLSRRFAAVLVEASDGTRIVRYAVGTGAKLGSTPVRPNVSARPFDVSDHGIVYRVGGDLMAIPTDTGRAHLVRRDIDGAAIEGRWIVGYRTRDGRSDVFRLTLR
jgi:hypothetical protein